MKKRFVRTVIISGLVLPVVAGTAAAGAPPGVPPLVKIVDGTANFCLDQAADTALAGAGIEMAAAAPAQLVTTGPHPCATTYVKEGAVSLGLTSGDFLWGGEVTFTRAADDARVTFSDVKVTFGVPGTATAVVNGDTAHPITLFSFNPAGNILTDARFLIAHDVPLNLTQQGADVFGEAFGTSPVHSGSALFVGTGYGQLEAALPSLPVIG